MTRDHRNLDAFKLADSITVDVYRETRSFPASERFGLQAQLRRAAVSVPTNLVEGCARRSLGEYARFVDVAFASARELAYLIDLARRLEMLHEATAVGLVARIDGLVAVLHGLRAALDKLRK